MKEDPTYNVLLLKEVEKYPILFNPNVQGYTNRDLQDHAWANVSAALNDSPANIKERWKHLRACLCRHLRNVQCHGLNKKPYYLIQHMKFLIPFTKTRSSIPHALALAEESSMVLGRVNQRKPSQFSEGYTDSGEHDGSSVDNYPGLSSPMVAYNENMLNQQMVSSSEPESFLPVKYEELDQEAETEILNSVPVDAASEHFSNQEHEEEFRPPTPKRSKFMHNPRSSQESVFARRAFDTILKEQDDPDLSFFKSLLPDVRRMSDDQKHRFKMRILESVGDILYSNNNNNT